MKKVLVFYSKTGGGHLRSAEAISSEIKKRGNIEVVLYDGLEQTGFNFKINPARMYGLMTTKLLPFWNFFYRVSNNTFSTKVIRRLGKLIWGKSLKEIVNKEQPDLVISVHFLMTSETTGTDKTNIPFIFVVTDLGLPHRSLFDDKADIIITPDTAIKNYAEKFIEDKTKIKNLGYPVRTHFYPQRGRKLTNKLLVMGGGMGGGNIEKIALFLIHTTHKKVIVVCGHNKALYEKLSKLNVPNLEVHKFSDDIYKLMTESDIVITKSGPGSVMEAAVMGKPLIITTAVGPQEEDNVSFVVSNKLGLFCPDIKNLGKAIDKIYLNYSLYSRGHITFQSGTKAIVDEILKLLAPNPKAD